MTLELPKIENKIKKRTVIHKGKFLDYEHLVLTKDGKDHRIYETITRKNDLPTIAALAYNDQHVTVIIEERPILSLINPDAPFLMALPAGLCEKNSDDPKAQIIKELYEEIGVSADSIEKVDYLGRYASSAGMTTEITELYIVKYDGQRGPQNLEKNENIIALDIPFDKINTTIAAYKKHGVFIDPKFEAAVKQFFDFGLVP